jgi:N-acetylglucosamine kinase-like BadF-type ATPase
MKDRLYLGIHGGARSGRVAVCDEQGTILRCIVTEPLSLKINQSVPDILVGAILELATFLNAAPRDLLTSTQGIAVTMSGVFSAYDADSVKQLLVLNGVIPVNNADSAIVCEDVWGIIAAHGYDCGGMAMASSGANVTVASRDGRSVRVDGWGSELGDWGSAYHLGILAIQRLLNSLSHRLPEAPQLEDAILAGLGLEASAQIINWYHVARGTARWRRDIAELAGIVVKLAEVEHDTESTDMLNRACAEFEHSIRTAIAWSKKDNVVNSEMETAFILAGGLCHNSRTYAIRARDAAEDSSFKHSLNLKVSFERIHPLIGALAMAMVGAKQIHRDQVPLHSLHRSAATWGLTYSDSII